MKRQKKRFNNCPQLSSDLGQKTSDQGDLMSLKEILQKIVDNGEPILLSDKEMES